MINNEHGRRVFVFLHIGSDQEIVARNVIGILNLDTLEKSKISQEFIKKAKDNHWIQNLSQDSPKSIVITEENQKIILYLSPISSKTLQRRIGNRIP